MSTAVGDQQIQEPQRGQAISRLPHWGSVMLGMCARHLLTLDTQMSSTSPS